MTVSTNQSRMVSALVFASDKEVFAKSPAWHGTSPNWAVLVEENSEVLAHVGIVERKIRVENEQISLAGVQNVFVLPAHRPRGFFLQIIKTSMQEAGKLGHDCGFLFCVPQLEKLYALCK